MKTYFKLLCLLIIANAAIAMDQQLLNAPAGCSYINPASFGLSTSNNCIEKELEKALDIYSSIKAAKQTHYHQQEAISKVINAIKNLANFINNNLTGSPVIELTGYKPYITNYKATTDLSKSRKNANTSTWYAVARIASNYPIDIYEHVNSIKDAINKLEESYTQKPKPVIEKFITKVANIEQLQELLGQEKSSTSSSSSSSSASTKRGLGKENKAPSVQPERKKLKEFQKKAVSDKTQSSITSFFKN